MLPLLAALGCGFLIGSRQWLPEPGRAWTRRFVNGVLILLLFCVGAKVGSHPQVLSQLGRFGWKSGGLALASTAASAAAAWLWSLWEERSRRRRGAALPTGDGLHHNP